MLSRQQRGGDGAAGGLWGLAPEAVCSVQLGAQGCCRGVSALCPANIRTSDSRDFSRELG